MARLKKVKGIVPVEPKKLYGVCLKCGEGKHFKHKFIDHVLHRICKCGEDLII